MKTTHFLNEFSFEIKQISINILWFGLYENPLKNFPKHCQESS